MTDMSILVTLLTTAVGLSVVYLVSLIWKNYAAKQELLKKSPHLPHAPGGNLVTGHTGLFATKEHNITTFHEYHKQLGKTYALFNQQNASIMTTEIELIKSIISDHSDRPYVKHPLNLTSPNSLVGARGRKWAKIRRAFAPALSSHKMKSSRVQAESTKMLNKLVEMIKDEISRCSTVAAGGKNCAEINLETCIARFTIDLILTNFFKQPNLITYTDKKDYWVRKLFLELHQATTNPVVAFLANLELFPIIDLIPYTPYGIFFRAIKRFTREAAELYGKARREAEIENKHDPSFDFTKTNLIQLNDGSKFERKPVDYIIDRLYDGTLTFNEFLYSLRFLYFAAERTLSDIIGRVLYNLSLHSDVQEKLRQLTAIEGAELQYMNWIIKETVRLHPPVNQSCARTLQRDVYTQDGWLIPSGTHVYASIYTIHRLKEYWGEDAEEFRPERWENEKNFDPGQFLGFGLGKRNCPGKDMAYYQIAQVIATLIMTFRFKKSDKSPTSIKFRSPFLAFTANDKYLYIKVENL